MAVHWRYKSHACCIGIGTDGRDMHKQCDGKRVEDPNSINFAYHPRPCKCECHQPSTQRQRLG